MAVAYFASILDHKEIVVITLKYTGTSKHSAFLASQYIDNCPPAMGFKINKVFIDNKRVADLLNRES